jgi:hypothetical protein
MHVKRRKHTEIREKIDRESRTQVYLSLSPSLSD